MRWRDKAVVVFVTVKCTVLIHATTLLDGDLDGIKFVCPEPIKFSQFGWPYT